MEVVKTSLTLLDPAYFGPFKTQGGGQICPQVFFPDLLLKNRLTIKLSQKSSISDPVLVSQSLSSQEIAVLKKVFFLTFLRSEATLAPFVRVPPYENKAFLTNSVIPRPKGKLFDHEKWFLTYLTYIEEYTKNYQNFHPLIFYGYTRLRGVGGEPPPPWVK